MPDRSRFAVLHGAEIWQDIDRREESLCQAIDRIEDERAKFIADMRTVGGTYQGIGSELGIPISSVKRYESAARRKRHGDDA